MNSDRFVMNGISWRIRSVPYTSPMLVDRTDVLRVATTNPKTKTVYLNNQLYGDFLMTVFIHELGHCALYSYDLLKEIHRMVYPEYRIEMEEFICNFLADYGRGIFDIAYKSMGYEAWRMIPAAFDKRFMR